MWSIQLENNTANSDAMFEFANDVGDAQYLKHFPIEFCSENVVQYYRLDRTLTVS